MGNTLADLNAHLFSALKRINDENLTGDKLEQEIKRNDAIVKAASTIVSNADLQLRAWKHMDEYGYNGDFHVPEMLVALNE